MLTLVDTKYRTLVVENSSGGLRVEFPNNREDLQPGQLVQVTGSAMDGTDPIIVKASVTILGQAPPATPAVPSESDLQKGLFEYRLVKVSGVVRSVSQQWTGRTALDLWTGHGLVQLRTIGGTAADWKTMIDSEIDAVGVVNSLHGVEGTPSKVRIWITQPQNVLVQRKAADPAGLPVAAVGNLLRLHPHQLPSHAVRLHGTPVRSAGSAAWTLSDATGQIPLRDAACLPAGESGQVDVSGFVELDAGAIVLDHCIPRTPQTATSTTGTLPLLQRSSEVRNLSPAQAARRYPVRLRAVVTYFDVIERLLFVQDRDGGIFVDVPSHYAGNLNAGDSIQLDAASEPGDFAPSLEAQQITPLGKGRLPEPASTSVEEVFLGGADSEWVELPGIVEEISPDQGQFLLEVAFGQHRYQVRLLASPAFAFSLLNSTVRLKGVCGTQFNSRRQFQGITLFVPGPEFVKVVSAGTEWARMPISPVVSLLQFGTGSANLQAARVAGTVLDSHPQGPTYIRDSSGAVLIQHHAYIVLQAGDEVELLGFPQQGEYSPVIDHAVVQKLRSGPSPAPVRADPEEILDQGLNAQLVEFDAYLANQNAIPIDQALILQSGSRLITARLQDAWALKPLEPGSLLRVRGISLIGVDLSAPVLLPATLSLQIRSPADVTLLKPAPWLNGPRTLRISLGLIGLILVALAWVFVLRRQVQLRTEQLRRAKDEAEAANRAKSEFLANMSHEIRTPLNGVMGMTDLVLGTSLTREQKEYLDLVKSSGESLLAVINDILDFSKIEAGKLDIESIDFNLRDCLVDAVRVVCPRAHEKGLELACDVAADVPEIVAGDALRLRQILVNLVNNGVKFTAAGEVVVSVEVDRSEPAGQDSPPEPATILRFSVRDTGIGIEADKQELVFMPFRQADGTTTRKYGGSGLGLSISSHLVEMMNGRIWLDSTPGQGTTVHFTIRFRPSQGVAREAAPREDRELAGLTALIVDDNTTNRLILERQLQSWLVEPTLAASGTEALDLLAQRVPPFSMIITDCHMPNLDGFEFVSRMKERWPHYPPRTLMLSSASALGDAARCRSLGINRHVLKPAKPQELYTALCQMVADSAAGIDRTESAYSQKESLPDGETLRLRVLLAEDNSVNQRVVQRVLEKAGHSVVIVDNGRLAVEEFYRQQFDLILMDVQMPEMDGFEATAEIRDREEWSVRRTPIIALTAHAMSGDRERCLQAGMDAYVQKPIDALELLSVIERLFYPTGTA